MYKYVLFNSVRSIFICVFTHNFSFLRLPLWAPPPVSPSPMQIKPPLLFLLLFHTRGLSHPLSHHGGIMSGRGQTLQRLMHEHSVSRLTRSTYSRGSQPDGGSTWPGRIEWGVGVGGQRAENWRGPRKLGHRHFHHASPPLAPERAGNHGGLRHLSPAIKLIGGLCRCVGCREAVRNPWDETLPGTVL